MLFGKGVSHGIRRLSEVCFGSGIALMLVVLLLDNSVFLLNFYVQSIGFYLQNLVQLGFHSDAFEQLGTSFGASDRGRGPLVNTDGPPQWMQWWTVGAFSITWERQQGFRQTERKSKFCINRLHLKGILLGLVARLVPFSGNVHRTDLPRTNREAVSDRHDGRARLLLLPLAHHLWRCRTL